MIKYDVIIVGGGPAGVALGIELGLNNINTLIIEKHAAPLLSPRAQSLSARSMEFFMRWGIDENLKAKNLLPPNYPIQGVWCSTLNGETYAVASSNELLDDSLSPQRGVRIPLWLTEETLRERLKDFSSVTFIKEQPAIDIVINEKDINVKTKDENRKLHDYKAKYVVACDGANSIIRKKIGIPFKVLAPERRVINILFESSDLEKQVTVERGFIYYLLKHATAAILPIDPLRGLWCAQIGYSGVAKKTEEVDLDNLLHEITGINFSKKIIESYFWNMHIQIAEYFSVENRVFLVGDSAHAFVPTGGFGLNTGFGDVINLGWKLSAVIKKQAKPSLLATYEEERRPVCLRNLQAAQKNADDMSMLREKYNPEKNPVEFARMSAELAAQVSQSLGAMMGYTYFESPLTQLNANQITELMPKEKYIPTSQPGYFLPHRWLENHQSIFKYLSPIYWTLIISGDYDKNLLDKWQQEFDAHNIILKILQVAENMYSFRYILIRPDWHIALADNEIKNNFFEYLYFEK